MEIATHYAQHYIECDNCEKNPANFLCKTCKGHLCETCKIKHGKKKLTKKHEIVDMISDKKYPTKHLPCFVHTTKKLECYCTPCQMPVCTECLIETHNGHKVKSLAEVYDKMRGELQEEKMEIETILLPRYQDLLAKENAKASEISKRADEVQKQIEVHTENVVKKVNMIKEERVQDLREKEQEAQKSIADTKNEIERRIKTLNNINEDISINLGVSQETAFLLTLENRKIEEMRKLPCSSDFYVENFRPGDLDEIINEGKFGDSLKFLSTEDIRKIKKEKRETPEIFSGDIDELLVPEFTLDRKAVLREFERCFRKKYMHIKIVHLYMGKQIHKGSKGALVVVIDHANFIDEKTFDYNGKMIDIYCKLWMHPSSECMLLCKFEQEHAYEINIVDISKIEQCLKMHSRSLLEKHSNLEIVSASAYRSKEDGENIYFEPCIVLYCSCKGVVPYEEKEFPKEICGIKTDVREGFFYLFPNDRYFKRASDVLDPLIIGASIGKKDENKEGTLGGFVTLNTGEIGFITCAHVLRDLPSNRSHQAAFEVVQPSYGYRNTNDICGVHVKSIVQVNQGVTVDASLVRLTGRLPQRGLFSELMANDLLEVGFSLEKLPEYATGYTRDYRKTHTKRTNLCIKCGARSGLTKGSLCVNGMSARCRDTLLILTNPPSQSSCLYLSQLEIVGIPPKPFAIQGDSGALVFQVDPSSEEEEDDQLFCIGMIVGGTSYYKAVVTPIESILESLSVKMHVFPRESMEES